MGAETLPHFLYMPRVKTFDEKEILTKAMNLFWKQGYSATSVQDLVSCLGINRASLYDTFGDKDQLFKKAFELYRTSNVERLTQFFEDRPNVKNAFSDLFDLAIHESVCDKEAKGCFVVNTITELIPNDESLEKVLEDNKRDLEALFCKYLEKGKAAGQLKTNQDLKSLAAVLYMLYSGMRVVSKVKPQKQELKKSVDVALTLLH